MSNHWHGVLTDPEARLPEFLERFHRLLAKTQNAHLGRTENLWSSDKPSVVLLATHAAIFEKMVYTLANPSTAGLVDTPRDWPGVVSAFQAWGPQTVERPRIFFDQYGRMPKETQLRFHRPKIYPEQSDDDFLRVLSEVVSEAAERAKKTRKEEGLAAVGVARVLARSPTSTPETASAFRNTNPKVASKSLVRRVDAIRGMQFFVQAYRRAWHQWRDGVRDVLFPAGTYALRINSGVTCAPY